MADPVCRKAGRVGTERQYAFDRVDSEGCAGGQPCGGAGGNAHQPQADFNQGGWPIGDAIDRLPQTGWGIYPEVGRSHTAVFELADPIRAAKPVF